jgi:hypothetical protein
MNAYQWDYLRARQYYLANPYGGQFVAPPPPVLGGSSGSSVFPPNLSTKTPTPSERLGGCDLPTFCEHLGGCDLAPATLTNTPTLCERLGGCDLGPVTSSRSGGAGWRPAARSTDVAAKISTPSPVHAPRLLTVAF